MKVLERSEVARLFHAARETRHVEDQAVAVQRIVVLVLDVNGDAVAGCAVSAVVGQEQVGFDAAVPQFAGYIRVHKLRVLYAVRAHEVQRRVDEVGGERQVLLAGENLLDAPVVVEIDVPVLVFLDDGVNVLAVVVCRLEFLEKECEFLSCHFRFHNCGNAPVSRTGEGPICYIDAFLRENMPENFVYVKKKIPGQAGDDSGEGCPGAGKGWAILLNFVSIGLGLDIAVSFPMPCHYP